MAFTPTPVLHLTARVAAVGAIVQSNDVTPNW
jgi:hypothetical protein